MVAAFIGVVDARRTTKVEGCISTQAWIDWNVNHPNHSIRSQKMVGTFLLGIINVT